MPGQGGCVSSWLDWLLVSQYFILFFLVFIISNIKKKTQERLLVSLILERRGWPIWNMESVLKLFGWTENNAVGHPIKPLSDLTTALRFIATKLKTCFVNLCLVFRISLVVDVAQTGRTLRWKCGWLHHCLYFLRPLGIVFCRTRCRSRPYVCSICFGRCNSWG